MTDDFNDDETAALADDARKARLEDGLTAVERELISGRIAPEDLPPVRLDPTLWTPPVIQVKPTLRQADPAYAAYRDADRRFRRAFGRLGSAGGRRQQMRAAHALAHVVTNKENS